MGNVAQTILSQLGGKRFIAMTGADKLGAGPDYLQFKLPMNITKGGINKIKITLDWTDTYIVEAMKITKGKEGWKAETVDKRDLIYFDNLQQVFTDMTGLYTSLN